MPPNVFGDEWDAPRTLQAFLRGDAEVDYFEGEPTE
jgi:hypothetical protein